MFDEQDFTEDTRDTRERLMQLLGQYTLQIEDLRAENLALKAKLSIRDGEPQPSANKGAEDRYNKLLEAHDALKHEHAKCDVVIAKALRKYQAARDSVQQWRAYIDKQHKKQQVRAGETDELPAAMPSTINGSSTPRLHSSEGVQARMIDQHGILSETVVSDPRPFRGQNHERTEAATLQEHEIIAQGPHVPHHSSGQTTDTDVGEVERVVKREPSSDDEPVVVAERVLKRKRNHSNPQEVPVHRIKQDPEKPDQCVTVLSDDLHDSTASARILARHETSDLDTIARSTGTPRLKRTRQWPSSRAISEDQVQRKILPGVNRLTRRWSSLSDSALQRPPGDLLSEQAPLQDLQDVDDRHVMPVSPSEPQSRSDGPLQPISVNIPRPSRDRMMGRRSYKQRKVSETEDKIALVAEDGDVMVGQRSSVQETAVKHVEPETKERLNAILERPFPDKLPLPRVRAKDARQPAVRRINDLARQDEIVASPASSKKRRVTPSRSNVASQPARSPLPIPSKKTPLRSRPPEMLKLDDFQINPDYLGTTFAFTDPIRGKEQRKCLPTCTRPDCCGGQYRNLIEIAGKEITARSDSQALEEYLGPKYESMVASYDPHKRNDLIMQAHAYSYANQHGSHRQAFQRESTPPGFWRTEMPSTQETEEDRRKAEAIERQKIEERWREAMHPGARWIFRDELRQDKGRGPYKSL